MNAVLADARPGELQELLAALPIFVRGGMAEPEAREWAKRILRLMRFHAMPDSTGDA